MNPFQNSYDHRLREWKKLRSNLAHLPPKSSLVQVDDWWQRAPLVNHHLHPLDTSSWPDPWTLLSDNIYCTLTRAVGICYTIMMSGSMDLKLVQATDICGDEHNLVLVDDAKYILNYYPGSVLSTDPKQFKIIRTLDLSGCLQHIR